LHALTEGTGGSHCPLAIPPIPAAASGEKAAADSGGGGGQLRLVARSNDLALGILYTSIMCQISHLVSHWLVLDLPINLIL
jgi:hypothetical protein